MVAHLFLSLGTKRGILEYYWVVAKLGPTVGIIITGVMPGDELIRRLEAPSGQATDAAATLGLTAATMSPPNLLSMAHLLMLAAATFLSVYKPWGKTWFGRRKALGLTSTNKQPDPKR